MITRLSETLAPIALITALLVWGMALLGFGGTLAFSEIATIGIATLLLLSAQAKYSISNLVLWASGGLWAGAAYVNTENIGLAYTLVALLTLAAAALRERQRGPFSIRGPAAFIAAMVVVIAASLLLSR